MGRTSTRRTTRQARQARGVDTGLEVTHVNGAALCGPALGKDEVALARCHWVLERLRNAGVHGTAHVRTRPLSWWRHEVLVDVYSPTRNHPGAQRPVHISAQSTRWGKPTGGYVGDVRIAVGQDQVGLDDDTLAHLCQDWPQARSNLMWAVMCALAPDVWRQVRAATNAGIALAGQPCEELVVGFVGQAGHLAARVSTQTPQSDLGTGYESVVTLADVREGLDVDVTRELFESFISALVQAANASLGMDCGQGK